MCNSKFVLVIPILIIGNSSYSCQVISEINFHAANEAFIELAFPLLNSSYISSGLCLLIMEDDPFEPGKFFTLSDVIIMDNITTNKY